MSKAISDAEFMGTLARTRGTPVKLAEAPKGGGISLAELIAGSDSNPQPQEPSMQGGIFKVPLAKLRPCPCNVRHIRSSERIEEIAQSLRNDGQREPISVYAGKEGQEDVLYVVSGETRRLAAASLGLNELEAKWAVAIDPSSPLSIVRASRLHNNTVPESDLDHALTAKYLMSLGHKQIDVATALGYDDRKLRRLAAFHELPQTLMDIGRQYPTLFSAAVAEMFRAAVLRLGEEAAQRILAESLKEGRSQREMSKLIDTEDRKQEQKKREQMPRSRRTQTYQISAGGQKVGEMKVLQVSESQQRVQMNALVSPEHAEALSAKLQATLREFANETTK